MLDAKTQLMAKFLPVIETDRGMPLAQIIDADYTAIAPIPEQDFSHILKRMDAQNTFITQGFEHLIKQNQSTDSRLTKLEQPLAQPVQSDQTAIALSQMAMAMQRLADKPSAATTINHYVNNTSHTDTHNVEIHGNNYGNICTDSTQKNGGGFMENDRQQKTSDPTAPKELAFCLAPFGAWLIIVAIALLQNKQLPQLANQTQTQSIDIRSELKACYQQLSLVARGIDNAPLREVNDRLYDCRNQLRGQS